VSTVDEARKLKNELQIVWQAVRIEKNKWVSSSVQIMEEKLEKDRYKGIKLMMKSS